MKKVKFKFIKEGEIEEEEIELEDKDAILINTLQEINKTLDRIARNK